mgnify:CR=1 FL=1
MRNPSLIGRYLNRLYHTRLGRWDYNRNGVDVFEEDWDNLIILDAARPELFESRYPGRVERRTSRGACTIEFLRGNFRGRDLSDTVYVTANPHLSGYRDELDVILHEVVDVWGGENWSSLFDTVLPETVEEEALKASESFPGKRLVIHFMQPHYPFIYEGEPEIEPGTRNIWQKASRGELEVSGEDAGRGYRQTFDRAWESVENLIEGLEGKTVVTSDHGNIYNERISPIPVKDWGHPIGIYDSKLVEVPWLKFDGDRREISSESSRYDDDVDEEEIKEKLGKLGYD